MNSRLTATRRLGDASVAVWMRRGRLATTGSHLADSPLPIAREPATCDGDRMSSASLVDTGPMLRAAVRLAMPGRHPHVGSEHIALLAIDGPDGIGAFAEEAGLRARAVQFALFGCCSSAPVPRATDDEPGITPRSVGLLATAAQAAAAAGHAEIGPPHLAVALLTEPGAIAWSGLRAGGATLEVVLDGLARRPHGAAWLALVAGSPAAAAACIETLYDHAMCWLTWGSREGLGWRSRSDGESPAAARAREETGDLLRLATRLGWLPASLLGIYESGDAESIAESAATAREKGPV